MQTTHCQGSVELENPTYNEDDPKSKAYLELTVYVIYKEWQEAEPYGDTYAKRTVSDHEVTDYELEDETVDLVDLYTTFGKKAVDDAIEEAVDNAIEGF
jgi:hypothetical protein